MTYNGKERRNGNPGRRKYDGFCALHEEIRRQDIEYFDRINGRISRMDEKVEGVEEKSVTKWTAGIITTVAMGFVAVILALASYQMRNMNDGIKSLTSGMQSVVKEQMRISTNQTHLSEKLNDIKTKQNKVLKRQQDLSSDLDTIRNTIQGNPACIPR